MVKKVAQNDIGTPAAPVAPAAVNVEPDFLLQSPCAPSGSGLGHKLGGRQSIQGKREASALAAEQRMSDASMHGLKKPRLSTPGGPSTPRSQDAPPVAKPESTSSSSSSSSEEADEEMRRAMELSLKEMTSVNASQDQEEEDLQEALRLSLESASSQDGPSPARFARLSAPSSALATLVSVLSSYLF